MEALSQRGFDFILETTGRKPNGFCIDGRWHYLPGGKFSYIAKRFVDGTNVPVLLLTVRDFKNSRNFTFPTNQVLNEIRIEIDGLGETRKPWRIERVEIADDFDQCEDKTARLHELEASFALLEESKSSPYFARKSVLPEALRTLSLREAKYAEKKCNAVSFHNIDGQFRGYQMFFDEGPFVGGKRLNKLNARGSVVNGSFYRIGNFFPGRKTYIAEGIATALSISEAIRGKFLSSNVLACLCCGNILPVVKSIREKYRSHGKIVICADDDRWKGDKNPGVEHAMNAAQKFGCSVVVPDFSQVDCNSKPTDFNDLHLLTGLEEVSRQLSRRIYGQSC